MTFPIWEMKGHQSSIANATNMMATTDLSQHKTMVAGEADNVTVPGSSSGWQSSSSMGWSSPTASDDGLLEAAREEGEDELASPTHDLALELTVTSIGGNCLAVLRAAPGDTVRQVKERLRGVRGATSGQQQLVYGRMVMQDSHTLAHCGLLSPKATVQLVIIDCASSISRHLEAVKGSATTDVGEALEASLADIVDPVFQAEHALSERWRPCPADLARAGGGAPTPRRRAELIAWMMQSFEILELDDAVLHAVVLTLDRYYARRITPMDDALLQRVLLAAVCTELKISCNADLPAGHWQHLLTHLCQGRVPITTILRTELEVLSRLGFVVGVPTPHDFLLGLSIRLRDKEEAEKWLQLARFFLEITLFDADLEYTYSHVILAAAALGASLRAFAAPAECHKDLLEDLAAYFPDLEPAHSREVDFFTCQQELLTLWVQCSADVHELAEVCRPLRVKLERNLHLCGGLALSPSEALRSLEEERCGVRSTATAEITSARGMEFGNCCSGIADEASSAVEIAAECPVAVAVAVVAACPVAAAAPMRRDKIIWQC